ncbi:MAG: HEAT repeat domain-containing protein [Deltaproteobacteria bacterium]|nr:HEAT repeat domain-containing protein [Deltaproteobacteria bacterium]
MTNSYTRRAVWTHTATHFGWAVLAFTCLALLPLVLSAQQGPPATAPPADQVDIPDYSEWTVEQAVVNIRSSDKGTRLGALRRLAVEPGASIQKWIAEAGQYDPEARIRYEAVEILGKRKETASLPILMHIADTDKDDRVRAKARSIVGAAGGPTPAPGPAPGPQPGTQPTQPGTQPTQPGTQPGTQPTQPGQPAPQPAQETLYDEDGNELPPGYTESRLLDRQKESDEWMATGKFSADEEAIVDVQEDPRVHSGFLPTVGYEGVIGTPRSTLTRTQAHLTIALARGTFKRNVDSVFAGEEVNGKNTFVQTDFSLLLGGSWSPIDFLEIGLDLEALTYEKLDHTQKWFYDEDEEFDKSEMTNPDYLFNDAGYGSAALGFLSLSLKGIFLDLDLIKAGIVLRASFPTHTGDKFDKGLGAPDLFRPTDEANIDARNAFHTRQGTFWAFEPGAVVSVAPIESLTVYADFSYMVTLMKYQRFEQVIRSGEQETYVNDLDATSHYLMTHVGVQYRVLDETLGFQLALQPIFYLAGVGDGGLAGFGIVPGFFYRIADTINLSLTFSIEAGGDAAKPFVCTDLTPDEETASNPCGVGRRFGFALQAGYTF